MSDSVWGTDSGLWPVMPEPLVPSREDLALYLQACPPALLHEDAAPRVLILGVTPALADLPWPRGAELHAVDFDEVMIGALWHPRDGAQVHRARWQEMPFEEDTFDLVIGDCSFNALPDVADYGDVLREVTRVSRPGAPLIARFFMQSEPAPDLAWIAEQVPLALAHYRAASKRVLVALACAEADGAFHMLTVKDRIREQWGDFDDYLRALGGPPEDFALSQQVFGYDQRLNYPTKRAICERFASFYREIAFAHPDYDAGGYCPIVRFA